jgi:hypothetical protein
MWLNIKIRMFLDCENKFQPEIVIFITFYNIKRLQFRELIRKYNCDLCYTPMIMSNSFIRSQKARDIEFTTNPTDRPLIVQFAANKSSDFAMASQFVRNFSDGVELNCGKYLIRLNREKIFSVISKIYI